MDFQVSIIGIIVVLAFYLPGYFFRKGYYSGFSTKQIGMEEWYDRFFKSVFYGLILQFFIISVVKDNFHFTYNSVSTPINQLYSYLKKDQLPDLTYANYKAAIIYLFISTTFAVATGFVIRQIVRKTRIDIRFTSFRYANIWHYYFRGDILKTNDFKLITPKGKVISTRADVLVDFEKDDKNILYSGIISQYDLSPKSDKLERIYLTQATRYSVKEQKFKDIPGHILVLDCHRILNMNLSYNLIEIRKERKKTFLSTAGAILAPASGILALLVFFSPVYLIPHFFYGKVNLFHTVLGVLFAILSLIYLMASVMVLAQKKFDKKYPSGNRLSAFAISFVAFLIFGTLLLLILKIVTL